MFKTLSTKTEHKAEEFVNIKTGEILPVGTTITSYKPKGIVQIHSDKYCTIDYDALHNIEDHISRTDIGTLVMICTQLGREAVLEYKNEKREIVPHNLKSLGEYLSLSPDQLSKIIKRFHKLGILQRTKLPYVKHEKSVFVINPTLIRTGKIYNQHLQMIFPDLTLHKPHVHGKSTIESMIEEFENIAS